MYNEEKENSQKVVVGFIVGMMIGALLLWVFDAPVPPQQKEVITYREIIVVKEYEECVKAGGRFVAYIDSEDSEPMHRMNCTKSTTETLKRYEF